MEEPWRYRNKVQLPIGLVNGELKIGFFAPRSHEIIDMESCLIQDEIADKVVELTRSWIIKNNIKPYNIDGQYDESGILRHIMIRRGFTTNEVMVVIVTNGRELPHKEEFINLMVNNIPGIKSIIQNINSKPTNVILGLESLTLWGSETICDYIGQFKYNISPLSFFQVNPIQTEVLYGKTLEYANLSGNETVFDAYCGTGSITLFLSQKAKEVYGVEIIPQAIENAKINAVENNVNNAHFYVGESEVVIPDLINQGIKADVVVVDPPRKGCDKKLLDAITDIDAKRIVYVSCDPSTLARDLAILEENGYKTVEVQPVDMFPHTAHVETVVLLSKGEIDSKKVRVEFSLEDMDMSDFQDKATYTQIKDYVLEHSGLKVSNLYISQIKRKCGLEVGKNYNLPKAEDSRQPQCPPEKENAIREAMKYFGMI